MRVYRHRVFEGLQAADLAALFDHPLLRSGHTDVRHPESSLYRGAFELGPGWHHAWGAVERGRAVEPDLGRHGLLDFAVDLRDLSPDDEDVIVEVVGPERLLDARPSMSLQPIDGYGQATLGLRPLGPHTRAGRPVGANVRISRETDASVPRASLVEHFLQAVGLDDTLAVVAGDRSVTLRPVDGGSRPTIDPYTEAGPGPCETNRPWFRRGGSSEPVSPPVEDHWSNVSYKVGRCLNANAVGVLARRLLAEPGSGWVRRCIELYGDPTPLVALVGRLAERGISSGAYVYFEAAYAIDALVELVPYAERVNAVVRTVTPPGGSPVALEVRRSRWPRPTTYPLDAVADLEVVAVYEVSGWYPSASVQKWLDTVREIHPAHAVSGFVDE